MNENWRGIFAIVVTPFTDDLVLDERALRRQVEFCIQAGAAGLVGPANAGEFATMSDEERQRWIRIVVEEADGRVPVVAATTHGHRVPAAALSRFAQEVGADGIMAMPPHILHPDADGCYEYFRTLNETLSIPICIQNFMGPIGTPMSIGFTGAHVPGIGVGAVSEGGNAAGAACYLAYAGGCGGCLPGRFWWAGRDIYDRRVAAGGLR